MHLSLLLHQKLVFLNYDKQDTSFATLARDQIVEGFEKFRGISWLARDKEKEGGRGRVRSWPHLLWSLTATATSSPRELDPSIICLGVPTMSQHRFLVENATRCQQLGTGLCLQGPG